MNSYKEYQDYKQSVYKEMCSYKNKSDLDNAYLVVKKGYLYLKDCLGINDPLTLDLMHLTSSRAKDAGKLDEAIKIAKQCYDLKTEIYGDMDIRSFRSRNHYIAFSGEKEGYEYSKREFKSLYEDEMELVNQYITDIGLEQTKKDHRDLLELTVTTLFNYANRLSYVGDYWPALRGMKKCYEESKYYLGEDFIITTRAEHNIIDRWVNVRNREEAIKQAIQCYIDRCHYIDGKTHKKLELKHLYSTKAVLLELLAYQIYYGKNISDDIKNRLKKTDLFPDGFHGTIDELTLCLREMITDFLAYGEHKTYEELHFYCVLAVLYSYKKDKRYIKILNSVFNEIETKDYYSNTNVDIVKIYTTMASHVIHSYGLSDEGINGFQMAEKILCETNKYLGASNHATLTLMYHMAVAYAEKGNMEEFYRRTSLYFSALSKFVSGCIDEENRKNVIQSTEFISTSFEDYVTRIFQNIPYAKQHIELIDPLIQYKNLLFDLDLFKSNSIDGNMYENENLSNQRKQEYIDLLNETNLKNVQHALSDDFTILDIYDLKNNNFGILLITANHIDMMVCKDLEEIKKHPLLKENVYIAPDGLGYELDYYQLDRKISFLSLAKSVLKYKTIPNSIENVDVYADPQFKIQDEIKEDESVDINKKYTRGIEQSWSYDVKRSLGKIPYSFLEGVNIKKIYGDKCNLYLKEQANVKNFRNRKRCDILHIATHADFLTLDKYSDPLEKARIYLAGYENCRNNQIVPSIYGSGFVSAKDIINMDFKNTQVVVLSACKTGVGETYDFQGIYGFRRAFELVSVQTLILTTATINDIMAAYFMEDFYCSIRNKLSVYEAFLHAQQKIRQAEYNEIEAWRIRKKESLKDDLNKMDTMERHMFNKKLSDSDISKDEWKNYIFIGNRN